MTISEQFDAPTRRSWRSRKVAAILAGGLVLGIGAAVTLAAWNDSEFASGTFSSGTFVFQGSTDGTNFADHVGPAGTPANVATMTVAPAGGMSPGDIRYAGFAVRTSAATTNAATVTVTVAASTGDAANYTYTLFTTATFGCSSSATPVTTLVTTANLTTTGGTAPTFSLPAGSTVNLCYKVTAGAGIAQNTTTTSTWQYAAQSN